MHALENDNQIIVCGIDEAGRGPLAGPVTAACVYIPSGKRPLDFWKNVTDSKKLSIKKRDMLFDPIRENSCYGIAEASAEEIDSLNIHHATLLAMKRAYEAMCRDFNLKPARALVDGKFAPDITCEKLPVIGGDALSLSIGAASILAKVTRDRLMTELHTAHPAYNWKKNAGYGTAEHMEAIKIHGVTIHHRRSYAPVRDAIPCTEAKA